MYARKFLAGLATAALTTTVFTITAGSASAAVDPDDTTFTPVAADLIGVGSDTSQRAIKLAAEAYNSSSPAPSARVASFAATGGGQITLPSGAVDRPNGSGAGKSRLYGAGNSADVDYARSSSAQNANETSAGLQSFPFALDTLVMAVSNNVPSHAPVSLTQAQIVSIYDGSVTNWSALGGTAGTIAPKIPQAGSGTRSFFVSQLKAANGGVDVVLAASVAEVQEHDDTAIKGNADAVAPFSRGRAGLLGTTLRLEGGFTADRALYNVVRGSEIGLAAVQSFFGSSGYLCSTAARPQIEAAGFDQLATPARGGVCGSPTQSASSNFTLNQAVVTATRVSVKATGAGTARVSAAVTGSTSPSGTVSFFEGSTPLAANVPLVSGQATTNVTGTPGVHTYRAVFKPATGSVFEPSEGAGGGKLITSSSISEAFKSKLRQGKKLKGVVSVALAGTSTQPTGKVVVRKGSKTIASGKLSGGKVTLVLKKGLKNGINKLTAVWSGDDNALGSAVKFTVKQLK